MGFPLPMIDGVEIINTQVSSGKVRAAVCCQFVSGNQLEATFLVGAKVDRIQVARSRTFVVGLRDDLTVFIDSCNTCSRVDFSDNNIHKDIFKL